MTKPSPAPRYDLAIALLGAGSDAGRLLPGVARQMGFPVRAFHALGGVEDAPDDDPDAEFEVELAAAEDFDFSRVPVVLDLGLSPHPERARALAAGARVIGRVPATGRGRLATSRLALAEIDLLPPGPHWHVPPPFAALAAPLLRALAGRGRLARLALTALYPAAAYGLGGVEGLAAQTTALLNAREVLPGVLPGRLAFNAMPDARADDDAALARALPELLPEILSAGDVLVAGATVPLFHGHLLSIAAWCEAAEGDIPRAERLAAAAGTLRGGGFRRFAAPARRGRSAPVFSLADTNLEEPLPVLGGWHETPDGGGANARVSCWLAADGITAGVVAPMLRLARRALNDA